MICVVAPLCDVDLCCYCSMWCVLFLHPVMSIYGDVDLCRSSSLLCRSMMLLLPVMSIYVVAALCDVNLCCYCSLWFRSMLLLLLVMSIYMFLLNLIVACFFCYCHKQVPHTYVRMMKISTHDVFLHYGDDREGFKGSNQVSFLLKKTPKIFFYFFSVFTFIVVLHVTDHHNWAK